MSKIQKTSRDRKRTSIYVLIVLFFIGVIVLWKYKSYYQVEKDSRTKTSIIDAVNSTEAIEKPESKVSENSTSLTKSEEKVLLENKSIILEPKKKENSPTSKQPKENKRIEPLKTKQETGKKITKEQVVEEELVTYRSNKNIDKRRPASSSNQCNAKNTLKIDKATIQVSVDFSPDGQSFAVGGLDDYVSILNIKGEEIMRLVGHTKTVQSVRYSPNGKFIVTGSGDHSAKIWDASDGAQLMNLEGHTDNIFCVAYSPNENYIASAGMDNIAILWDATSGKKIFQLKGHKREVSEVAFSNDSKLLITCSSDRTVRVWDVMSGKTIYAIEEPSGGVSGVAFTKDDKLIVTGGSDKKIRLWETKTGKHIHTISGHKGWINSIKISSDGENILSTDLKGVAKIWEIKNGEEVCELIGHTARIREATFNPVNKNMIVSVGNDNTIRMWQIGIK